MNLGVCLLVIALNTLFVLGLPLGMAALERSALGTPQADQ